MRDLDQVYPSSRRDVRKGLGQSKGRGRRRGFWQCIGSGMALWRWEGWQRYDIEGEGWCGCDGETFRDGRGGVLVG